LIERAIKASLKQTAEDKLVVVIDDGSTDHTHAACVPFFSNPDFLYVRLGRNLGTAAAKNVALAIVPFDAITFHDSDDVPHRDKVLRQVRTLERDDLIADPCLPWHINNKSQQAGGQAKVDLVLTAHTHIAAMILPRISCTPLVSIGPQTCSVTLFPHPPTAETYDGNAYPLRDRGICHDETQCGGCEPACHTGTRNPGVRCE
jgi:glycosyltransferase involved in cell wall biosynthesis